MKKITLIFVLFCSTVMSSHAYPINLGLGRVWGCFGGCFPGGGMCVSDLSDPLSRTFGDLSISSGALLMSIPSTSAVITDLGPTVTFDANTAIDPIVAAKLGAKEGYTFFINAGTYPVLYLADGSANINFPFYMDVCKK